MAIQSVTTTFAEEQNNMGQYVYLPIASAANTSKAVTEILAPADGELAAVQVAGSVTSDGTKTYVFKVLNATETTVPVAEVTYDADPVLTADTATDLTVVGASGGVSRGDLIQFEHTGGTGSGDVIATLIFKVK